MALSERETDIIAAILQYLLYRRFNVWRSNTGAAVYENKYGKKRFVRYGKKGISDIVGMMPDGRFLAIEVKRSDGKLTADQSEFLDGVIKNNGVAFMARSIDDVQENLKQYAAIKA